MFIIIYTYIIFPDFELLDFYMKLEEFSVECRALTDYYRLDYLMIKSKWWTNKLYRMTSSYAKGTEIAELWSHWGMEAERMAVRQQELSYNWTMTLNAEPHIVREGKKVTKLQAGHSLCGTRQSSLQTSCRKEMGLRTVLGKQSQHSKKHCLGKNTLISWFKDKNKEKWERSRPFRYFHNQLQLCMSCYLPHQHKASNWSA